MILHDKLQRFLYSLLLAVFCMPVNAEIYKWVDEHGETHYSQKKPGDGVEVSTVKPPPRVDTEAALQEKQRKLREEQERNKVKLKKSEAERKAREETALKKSNCDKAKARVTSMQRPRVNMVDAQGNRTRISEEQRQKQLAEAQKAVKEHCQ